MRFRKADGGLSDTTLDRVSVDDVVAGLPVRVFRSYKGRQHYSGWYWSAVLGRLVVYESRLELARIMLADFDPAVAGLAAQPFLLAGADGGRVRRHVPDLLLVGADGGVTVVDVKAPSRMADPAVEAQFSWTREVCAGRGWGFEAWSGADPRLLANVRFLAGYRRKDVHRRGPDSGGARYRIGAAVGRGDRARSCRDSIRRCWSGLSCCTCCGPASCKRT